MAISTAQKHFRIDTKLQSTFGGAFDESAYDAAKSMRQNQAAQAQEDTQSDTQESATETLDKYECNPWTMDVLKRRVMNLIARGQHGEALDLLETHMEFSQSHKEGALTTLERALEGLEDLGYSYQVQQFTSLLFDSQLGMDIEFHNTGPNSPSDTEEAGEIKRLRHRIEEHYDKHRHMSPSVPQFIGVSVGPR